MNPITGGANSPSLMYSNSRSAGLGGRLQENVSSVVFGDRTPVLENRFYEEERNRRQAEYQKKQDSYMKRREAKVLQEAGRWQAVEETYKKSLENLEIRRSKWKMGQKNNAGEAYNLITLDYDSTHQGDYLRQRDEEKKYRENLRLYNLDARMNSGFNIITGATRQNPILKRN